MNEILNVQNVSKSFGGVVANENISINVNKGEIVGLIGPNGSGKTTLFNSIVGHHIINKGKIIFGNNDITNYTIPKIARLGLIRTFQKTKIYSDINCIKNMRISISQKNENFFSMFSKVSTEVDYKAEELLKFVGLYKKRFLRAGELSFGQQKLLEFAMALMNEPKMLLLDEPTAGINPTLINSLIDRLKVANKEFGITFLVIEHNMRVIMNLAERIYCLAHGKLLADGTPKQIVDNSKVINAYLGSQ